jgi:hypothetical protein
MLRTALVAGCVFAMLVGTLAGCESKNQPKTAVESKMTHENIGMKCPGCGGMMTMTRMPDGTMAMKCSSCGKEMEMLWLKPGTGKGERLTHSHWEKMCCQPHKMKELSCACPGCSKPMKMHESNGKMSLHCDHCDKKMEITKEPEGSSSK